MTRSIRTACDRCTQRKVRCDGRHPCYQCMRRQEDCYFSRAYRSTIARSGCRLDSSSPGFTVIVQTTATLSTPSPSQVENSSPVPCTDIQTTPPAISSTNSLAAGVTITSSVLSSLPVTQHLVYDQVLTMLSVDAFRMFHNFWVVLQGNIVIVCPIKPRNRRSISTSSALPDSGISRQGSEELVMRSFALSIPRVVPVNTTLYQPLTVYRCLRVFYWVTGQEIPPPTFLHFWDIYRAGNLDRFVLDVMLARTVRRVSPSFKEPHRMYHHYLDQAKQLLHEVLTQPSLVNALALYQLSQCFLEDGHIGLANSYGEISYAWVYDAIHQPVPSEVPDEYRRFHLWYMAQNELYSCLWSQRSSILAPLLAQYPLPDTPSKMSSYIDSLEGWYSGHLMRGAHLGPPCLLPINLRAFFTPADFVLLLTRLAKDSCKQLSQPPPAIIPTAMTVYQEGIQQLAHTFQWCHTQHAEVSSLPTVTEMKALVTSNPYTAAHRVKRCTALFASQAQLLLLHPHAFPRHYPNHPFSTWCLQQTTRIALVHVQRVLPLVACLPVDQLTVDFGYHLACLALAHVPLHLMQRTVLDLQQPNNNEPNDNPADTAVLAIPSSHTQSPNSDQTVLSNHRLPSYLSQYQTVLNTLGRRILTTAQQLSVGNADSLFRPRTVDDSLRAAVKRSQLDDAAWRVAHGGEIINSHHSPVFPVHSDFNQGGQEECPPCFNCLLPAYKCSNYANCSEFSGRCDCPVGFGGEDCAEPVCGSLADGNQRKVRQGETCACEPGWQGINCNVCQSDKVCDTLMPEGINGTCYQGGLVVHQNFQMCNVTNRKIIDMLPDQPPQVTFSCQREPATCSFQFWIKERESFYCKLDQCDFSEDHTYRSNRTKYHCEQIACECMPGRKLCGEEGSIDITDFLVEEIQGPATFDCQSDQGCRFEEPAMNDLIMSVFGDSSITLECDSGECLHYSEVPGFERPQKRTNTLLILVTVGAGIAFTIAIGFSLLYLAKARPGLGSGYMALPTDDLEDERDKLMSQHVHTTLSFKNVSYTVHEKPILHDVQGVAYPGQIMAIMGASGAGKTTFLDILARRNKTGDIQGDIQVNGRTVGEAEFKRVVGFVDQEDTLMPTLTVYETILYSALLRLPRDMSRAAKQARVLETLHELDIMHIKDSRIGNATTRGISGGEKRRVSIACELVTSPSILFLDEPTSGLDAYNAYNVVECLVNLARNYHRTIIFTIHQPRSNIFALFDQLVLLAEGYMVYSGKAAACQAFFESVGHPCPLGFNIADFIVDLTKHASRLGHGHEDGEPSDDEHQGFGDQMEGPTTPSVIPSNAHGLIPERIRLYEDDAKPGGSGPPTASTSRGNITRGEPGEGDTSTPLAGSHRLSISRQRTIREAQDEFLYSPYPVSPTREHSSLRLSDGVTPMTEVEELHGRPSPSATEAAVESEENPWQAGSLRRSMFLPNHPNPKGTVCPRSQPRRRRQHGSALLGATHPDGEGHMGYNALLAAGAMPRGPHGEPYLLSLVQSFRRSVQGQQLQVDIQAIENLSDERLLFHSEAEGLSLPVVRSTSSNINGNDNNNNGGMGTSSSVRSLSLTAPQRSSWATQFTILADRTFKNLYRDPLLLVAHYLVSLFLAVLCGLLFYQVTDDISGFQNRMGVFFFMCALFGFSCLTSLQTFATEKILFMRERANGYYAPATYFAAKVVFDIFPLRVIPPLLLGCIVYPMVGLVPGMANFSKFILVLVLFNLAAASICLCLGIIFRELSVSNLLSSLAMLFSMLFGGLLLNKDSIPYYMRFLKDLSIFNYALEAMIVNEMKYLQLREKKFGLEIDVPGATILSTFGFNAMNYWPDVAKLGGMFLVFIGVAFVCLQWLVKERR
ncbi:FAD-dependent urate hydroxylase [Dispira simplex]|nr:FAD-dependent urate hydroxylase [Dispira simplex]